MKALLSVIFSILISIFKSIASKDVIVKADKTRKMYAIDKENYMKLLGKNITKIYRKADEDHTKKSNRECKQHAIDLKIENKMEIITERSAFISIKDHKDNFPNNIQCRLINPARNNLGKVTQTIIRKAVTSIKKSSSLNLWMGTNEVLEWYEANKQMVVHFIQYDIEEYYPSITEPLLDKAIDFARGFYDITEDEKNMIKTCRQSILYGTDNHPWTKKDSNFDVTMRSLDGAELSELIGLFMLNEAKNNISGLNSMNNGLYRDDGLIMLEKCPGPRRDKVIKDLHKLYKSHGLKITIASSGPVANYLDVTVDLSDGSYRPYRKPNDIPVYINAASNHPPSILKHIPRMVERRLQSVSSDKSVFNEAKPPYEEALKRSGFDTTLVYKDSNKTTGRRSRKRQIIWFNPPYCQSIETNVARKFLILVDKHFPPDHRLRKIFDRNTLKVSYSCMPNIDSTIKSHNNRLISNGADERSCNYRKNNACPVEGHCFDKGVIYEATVKSETETKKYVGLTEGTFKRRLYGHRQSFNNNSLKNSTELSKYIWHLKEKNEEYDLSWDIIDKATPYNGSSNKCSLCILEKYHILMRNDLLNSRNELVSKCRHRRSHLIGSVK